MNDMTVQIERDDVSGAITTRIPWEALRENRDRICIIDKGGDVRRYQIRASQYAKRHGIRLLTRRIGDIDGSYALLIVHCGPRT